MGENKLKVLQTFLMIIEWLGFLVKPQLREKFLAEDQKIWTPILAESAGFLGKEIWLDPARDDRVFIIVRWRSREQWKAISPELLAEIDQKFALAMGTDNYQMLESTEYQSSKSIISS
ncbi:putative cyanobacterial protein, TIGR03792 family [Xenococcus sp. PCC 7305]|nr:putative cyanobacterial protein, TIGR03792 family [Xenococcus sp. PCC 7305]